MTQSFFVRAGVRNTLRKIAAGLLVVSLNLTGGVSALFIGTEVGFAAAPTSHTGIVSANETISSIAVGDPDQAWSATSSGHALFSAATDYAVFGFPDLNIPSGAVVQGVEVYLTGALNNNNTPARHLSVSLWDGAVYTAIKTESGFTKDTSTQTLGSQTDLRGKNWTSSSFSDAIFKIKIEATTADSGRNAFLDQVAMRVYYTIASYLLNVSVSGLGTITSTPAGISCNNSGSSCGAEFTHGSEVTLTAAPDTGYTFFGWSGACTGTGACSVTMDSAKTVVATFKLINTGTDEPTPCPSGTSEPDCTPIPPQETACTDILSTVVRTSNTADVHLDTPVTGPLAVAVGLLHGAWTSLTGSTWIWSESPIVDTTTSPTETFYDVFTITGTPTGATLEVAGDNSYTAYINDVQVDTNVDTYGAVTTVNITADKFVTGQNTLKMVVTNQGVGQTEANPAGILYKLTVNKNACVPPGNVVVTKEVVGGTKTATDFTLKVGGTTVTSGASTVMTPGTYTVTEVNTDEQYLPSFSGACVADEGNATKIASIQNWMAKKYALQEAIYADPMDEGVQAKEELIADIDVKIDALLAALSATVTVTTGTTANCTITNTYTPVAPICNPAMNLVDNGGFEAPALSATSYQDGWDIVPFTEPLLKWLGMVMPSGESVGRTGVELQANVAGAPHTGAQHAEMDGDHPTEIYQDIVTIPGKTYQLSYWWSPRPDTALAENNLEASVAESVVGTHTGTASGNTNWQQFLYTFTADATTTRIAFKDLGPDDSGTSGGVGSYLDDVSVHCVIPVPENTPAACMDGKDNDFDGMSDTMDPDCRPTLTVVKTVVGGSKVASEFTLHVNVDVCTNVDGMQTEVPEGMWSEGTYCEEQENEAPIFHDIPPSASIFDIFSIKTAIADVAELIAPATFVGSSEGTQVYFEVSKNPITYTVTEDADTGYTATYSADCTGTITWGEQKTCTVTNTAVSTGGGGSTTFDHWGCTNPVATNYNPLSNRDDGSCKVPSTPGDGGNGGGSGNASSTGEVLGAATTEPEPALPPGCSPYLLTYMKLGKKNDADDVKRLQTFLNEHMSATLPVTGFFGPMTKSWVKKFQKANHSTIIQPWLDAGHTDIEKDGSGVVYKTTKRAINLLKCESLNEPMPTLENDPGYR